MSYTSNSKRYDSMKYKPCGDSGLKLPAISLGLWHNFGDNADYDNMCDMIFTAFDNGITHFDIADNYGPAPGSAERNFGNILNDHLKKYRDELIISTKAGYYMWEGPYGDFGSRKHLCAGIDQSLKRLNIEYVDIFYHHRMDKNTPLYETMWALDRIVKSGKALYIGLSNYDGETMKEAAKILRELHCPFVINQNRYSIFDRTIENDGLIESAKTEKKGIITFSPLAQGLLTDRYTDGIPGDSRIRTDGRYLKEQSLTTDIMDKVEALNVVASERGQSLAQMALSWLYSKEEVTSVLIGASKPGQITENIKMLENTEFSEEELKMIDSISLS